MHKTAKIKLSSWTLDIIRWAHLSQHFSFDYDDRLRRNWHVCFYFSLGCGADCCHEIVQQVGILYVLYIQANEMETWKMFAWLVFYHKLIKFKSNRFSCTVKTSTEMTFTINKQKFALNDISSFIGFVILFTEDMFAHKYSAHSAHSWCSLPLF